MEEVELTGQVIAEKYRLDQMIGKGGFGRVYAGEHLAMARRVAIKVISMNHPKVQQQDGLERFSREARLISQLQSPHTVSVFDYGVESRMLYLVMEYIEGETLKALLKREKGLAPERTARLGIQILKSLEEAHHRGILHRDLKPANIMVFRDFRGEEQVKVLDFGIAKVMNPARARAIGEPDLTEAQGFIGTPRYAAPEQLFAQQLSAITDLYGVGMLLWEMLTGKPALKVRSWGECSNFHVQEQDRPMRMPTELGLPVGLVHIVERGVMRYARDRWESAAMMREALEGWLENPESASLTLAPSPSVSSAEDDFWTNAASKSVDPNLHTSHEFFGEDNAPTHIDLFGDEQMSELSMPPRPLRTPERERKMSTLEQADWGQSASHIPVMSAEQRQVDRRAHHSASQEPASVSGSGLNVRPEGLEGGAERADVWRKVAIGACVCVAVAVLVYVVAMTLQRNIDAHTVNEPFEQVDSVLDGSSGSFEVPEGRFSQEGIWLAVQAAKWRRTSSVETIDLKDVRQYTAFYERRGVTCEITLIEARSEMALHELVQGVRTPTSVVRFDYRAVKLHPVKGEGMLKEVAELEAHLKKYKRLVISERDRERQEAP